MHVILLQNPFISILRHIIDSIVQVFDTKISKAHGLSEADKASLKADLKAITQNALDYHDVNIRFKYDDVSQYDSFFQMTEINN